MKQHLEFLKAPGFWLLVFFVFIAFLMQGCAFWDGFQRGVTGQSPIESGSVLDSVGQTTGYAVVDTAVFFPSPWREILIALISGATGWAAAARKEET